MATDLEHASGKASRTSTSTGFGDSDAGDYSFKSAKG